MTNNQAPGTLRFELENDREDKRQIQVFACEGGAIRWTERKYQFNYVDEEEELVFETTHRFALADDGKTVAFNGKVWQKWADEKIRRARDILSSFGSWKIVERTLIPETKEPAGGEHVHCRKVQGESKT